MTKQDMITAIVQAVIDGGYYDNELSPEEIKRLKITVYPTDVIIIRLPDNGDGHIYNHPTSLSKLIFDPAAMCCAFGEEEMEICNDDKGYCLVEVIPAFTYHQMQAIKLSGGDYVKYLYDNLPGGER